MPVSSVITLPIDPGLRVACTPPIPAEHARFGWQIGDHPVKELELIAAAGGSVARTQFGLEAMSDWATGTPILKPVQREILEAAARLGIALHVVAAYGPPYRRVAAFTVAEDVPTFSFRIPTVQDASAIVGVNYDAPGGGTDWVAKKGGQVTKNWGYYGSLVAKADAGGLTLAAESLPSDPGCDIHNPDWATYLERWRGEHPFSLRAGDEIFVNRHSVQAMYQDSPDTPFARWFARECLQIATWMHEYGVEGFVDAWNEDGWQHDRSNRAASYFTKSPQPTGNIEYPGAPGVPAWVQTTENMRSLGRALAAGPDFPEGVRVCNGATDKTAWAGWWNQAEKDGQADKIESVFPATGNHPYGINPETQGWDRGYVKGKPGKPQAWYAVLNKPADETANFPNGGYTADHYDPPVFVCATEYGANLSDDERNATYMVRSTLTRFACNQRFNSIYHFSNGNYGAARLKSKSPLEYELRPSYHAMQRLAEVIAALGPGEGDPASAPYLIATEAPGLEFWPWANREHPWPAQPFTTPFPLMTTTMLGENGAALFAWQRTFAFSTYPYTQWANCPQPAPASAEFYLSPRYRVSRALDLVTGEAVDVKGNGTQVTFSFSDHPVVLITEA